MINTNKIDKEIFNIDFISLFPKKCTNCDSDMYVTDSLTKLICSNPYCKGKVRERLKSLVGYLDINLSEEEIVQFIDKFNIESPYYIFFYNPKKDGVFSDLHTEEQSIEIYKQINKNRIMLLWEFLYLGNLPFLKESSEILFKNYTDIKSFYRDLEEKGMGLIQELLTLNDNIINDINEDEILSQTILIYDTLNTYKKEIVLGSNGVIIPQNVEYVPIFFASEIGKTTSIREFLQTLNQEYKGICYFYRTYDLWGSKYIFWEPNKGNKKTELMRYIDTYYRDREVYDYESIIRKIGEDYERER